VSIIIIKDNHAFLIQNPSSLASFPPRNTGGKGQHKVAERTSAHYLHRAPDTSHMLLGQETRLRSCLFSPCQ
jgi:hypothetical protein